MAHELDTRSNGVHSVFSVGETPWHRLGTVLTDAPSFDEGLKLGGLDFPVELVPIVARRTVEIAEGQTDTVDMAAPDHQAVVRTDRGAVLGVVGSRYTPIQNADAFAPLRALVDGGVATLETGGAIAGGRRVWMMARFDVQHPTVQEVYGELGVVPFALISNAHDGSRALTVQETPIRVVCRNTLDASLQAADGKRARSAGVRHTLSIHSKTIEAAHELFGGVIQRHVAMAEEFRLLTQSYMSEESFARLVLDVALPMPAKPVQASAREAELWLRSSAKAERRRAVVRNLWTAGAGHKGDSSAWEAVNGLIEALDHDRATFPARDEVASLMEGHLGDVKQRVTAGVVAYARIGATARANF